MFDRIGEKIKTLAFVCTLLGMVASFAGAVCIWATDELKSRFIIGLVILIFGCLFSWIGSFILYGFGELIEKTTETAERLKKLGIKEGLIEEPEKTENVENKKVEQSTSFIYENNKENIVAEKQVRLNNVKENEENASEEGVDNTIKIGLFFLGGMFLLALIIGLL